MYLCTEVPIVFIFIFARKFFVLLLTMMSRHECCLYISRSIRYTSLAKNIAKNQTVSMQARCYCCKNNPNFFFCYFPSAEEQLLKSHHVISSTNQTIRYIAILYTFYIDINTPFSIFRTGFFSL